MVDTLLYQPYRCNKTYGVVMFTCSLLSMCLTGLLFLHQHVAALLTMAVSLLSCVLGFALFRSANIYYFLFDKGIQIIAQGERKSHYYPWTNFSDVYYLRTCKGHSLLVLATKKLNKEQRKRLLRKFSYCFFVASNESILIYMDITRDTSQIERFIREKIGQSDKG